MKKILITIIIFCTCNESYACKYILNGHRPEFVVSDIHLNEEVTWLGSYVTDNNIKKRNGNFEHKIIYKYKEVKSGKNNTCIKNNKVNVQYFILVHKALKFKSRTIKSKIKGTNFKPPLAIITGTVIGREKYRGVDTVKILRVFSKDTDIY